MYRVLVVDDSVFMRKIISDLINSDPSFEVIATARNGNEALDKIRLYNPDIVTLDIEMPVMNGLETLFNIMNQYPRPVIMLSAYSHKEAESTFKAMELGAIDFLPKPSGEISLDLNSIKETLIQKLKSALTANLHTVQRRTRKIDFEKVGPSEPKDHFIRKVLVIASSTGGPKALVEVVPHLPLSINCPVLIVQHMQAEFTTSFAERLNSLSILPVSEARQDEILQNGHVYIAPGDFHMTVEKDSLSRFPLYRIQLDQREKILGVRPNANFLFTSAVEIFKDKTLGVVLTGMGKDGAEGAKLIRDAGGRVITEDESTSIVFGMPKVAGEFATKVLPLFEIPELIVKYLKEMEI